MSIISDRSLNAFNSSLDIFQESFQERDYKLASNDLWFTPERYREGAELLIFFEPMPSILKRRTRVPSPQLIRFRVELQDCALRENYSRTTASGIKIPGAKSHANSRLRNWNNNSMFIGQIDPMELPEIIIPTRVDFEFAECSDDIFGGAMYLPLRECVFKAIADREGHSFFIGPEGKQGFPCHQIQCATHIMNGISDDEPKLHGHGFVGFRSDRSLAGMWIIFNGDTKGMRKISTNFPVKIVDMMFGPFDL